MAIGNWWPSGFFLLSVREMISKKFERINEEILERLKITLYEEQLFDIILIPLWQQSDGDLNPVEVWMEALMVVHVLRKTEERYRPLEIGSIVDALKSRYSCFGAEQRSPDAAKHTTMLVMSTVMFMLSIAGRDDGNPHKKVIKTIVAMICKIDGFSQLCSDVKKEEHIAAEDSRVLPVCDIMKTTFGTENMMTTFTDDDAVRECDFNHSKPKAILQAIYVISRDFENLNDWIAVYAVLRKRNIIKKTMTTFCNMVRNVFGTNIDSRYMNNILKDHGEEMTRWKPTYDDQDRHLKIARRFGELLDEYLR